MPRKCAIEQLEPRAMFDGNGLLLSNDAYLTLSFAADGTSVAGQTNALAAKFDAIAPEAVWKNAILSAFQTWASRTNADIGVVGDGGQPFGSPGPSRGDSRFGDIRIAAIGMDPLVGGASTPIDRLVGGTWKADVLFNTNFSFQSVNDIYEIALHEAGHVFGLEDNADPNSPLHSGTIPTATAPTVQDTANLQALYGVRLADFNETENGKQDNDSFTNATVLVVPSSPTVVAGSVPVLIYGDITSNSDADYFRLKMPDTYSGPMNVVLRSTGISLLAPHLQVYDQNHQLVQDTISSSSTGDSLTFSLPSAGPNDIYYLKVSGATSDVFGIGGYSLKATFDAVQQADLSVLNAYRDSDLRKLSQDEIRKLEVPSNDHFLSEDTNTNDDPTNAIALQEKTGFADPSRYETVGSISSSTDTDFYQVRSPQNIAAPANVLTVAIHTLSDGQFVPKVRVFDRNQVEMPVTILANGGGEVVVQVGGIESNHNYFVEVAADDPLGPFKVGNYQLTASFRDQAAAFQTFAVGTVPADTTQTEHTLYVAQPQLFHFLLQSQGMPTTGPIAIVATIYDAAGNTVFRLADPVGSTESQGAVLLATGTYKVRFSAISLNGVVSEPIDYKLSGIGISDPFASDPNDQTTNPFVNPDPSTGGAFVYPGNIHSNDPALWDSFISSLPSPPPADLQTQITLLIGNWWSWFWQQTGVNGPPLAQSDRYSTASNAPLSISQANGALANDVDPESDPMAAVLVAGPQSGALSFNSDGSFQYTPAAGFNGAVQFTYQTSDFRQLSNQATVSIAVGLVVDYDHNGIVDQGDYDTWRGNFGATGLANGDGNGNSVVDAGDFVLWRKSRPPAGGAMSAFAATTPPTTAVVSAVDSSSPPAARPAISAPIADTRVATAVAAESLQIASAPVAFVTSELPTGGTSPASALLLAIDTISTSTAGAQGLGTAIATDLAFEQLSTDPQAMQWSDVALTSFRDPAIAESLTSPVT